MGSTRQPYQRAGPASTYFPRVARRANGPVPVHLTLPDDKVDEEGVWSDGPLRNDFSHRAAVLGMI